MSVTGLVRTQYWNLSGPNPTPRTGLTSRAESRTDVEGYLLVSDAARNAALHVSGVASGLEASAAVGEAGVTVAQGTAFDLDGHVVVIAVGGVAITDPTVGPTGEQNIPTVPVTDTGVTLDTASLVGDRLLTITWREVEEATEGLLVLRQAPWLRLVDPATFDDDGLQLVLAAVTLGTGGVVDALEPGGRRVVATRTGRLELHLPRPDSATGLVVGQVATGELVARSDGGADFNVLPPTGPARCALSVAGGTGDVDLGAGLRVAGNTALASGLTVSEMVDVLGQVMTSGNIFAGGDLAVARNVGVEGDVEVTGELSVRGAGSTEVNGDVHVGSDLAVDGVATLDQLAVRGNATVGAGGDAGLKTRHVTGKQSGGDAPDGLFLNWDTGHAVHVGGAKPADLVVSDSVFVAGRVGVKTSSPNFDVHVVGTVCATTFCNPSDLRLKSDVADLVGVLDRLANVRGVTFTPAHAGPDNDVPRRAGVVAQDVVGVFPELVVPMGPDGTMAVDYAGLAGVLVAAVNELRAANAVLESRVADVVRRGSGDDDENRE